VTSDSTGQYLAAVSPYNGIYTSSSGALTYRSLLRVCISFILYFYHIYFNCSPSNVVILILTGGSSWTKTTAPAAQWSAIASDSTGMYLVAVQGSPYGGGWNDEEGIIYTSTSGKRYI